MQYLLIVEYCIGLEKATDDMCWLVYLNRFSKKATIAINRANEKKNPIANSCGPAESIEKRNMNGRDKRKPMYPKTNLMRGQNKYPAKPIIGTPIIA